LLVASFATGLLGGRLLDAGAGVAGGLSILLCVALAWLGARVVGADRGLPRCPLADRDLTRRRRLLRWLPALALAALTAAVVAAGRASDRTQLLLWLVSLTALVAPLLLPGGTEPVDPASAPHGATAPEGRRRVRRLEVASVVLVLVAAAAVRLVALERFPLVVHNDEANCGIMAQEILAEWRAGEVHWFAPREFFGFPTLGFVPSAIGQALFPPNLLGHRLANVALSMGALLCLYLLLRDTVGWPAAVAGLWLGSIGHFSVHFSRSGIHSGHAGFLTIVCAWLLWKALRTGRAGWFVAAGSSLALCGLTYHAALAVPLWLALVVGAAWLASREVVERHGAGLVLALIAAAVVLAPEVGSWSARPGSFIGRSGSMIFTTDADSVRHMKACFGEDYLPAVLEHNLGRALQLFSTVGDSNLQYGYHCGGMLDHASAALLFAGLGVGLGWRRRAQVWPVLVGIALTWVLGAVLTLDAVQYSRVTGLMLLVCIPQAWCVVALLAGAERAGGVVARRAAVAVVLVGLAWVGWINLDLYFVCHDRAAPLTAVQQTVIARDARDDGPSTETFISAAVLPTDLRHRTPVFLAAGRWIEAFTDPTRVAFPSDGRVRRLVVVLAASETELRSRLMARFPDAVLERRRVRWYREDPLFDRLVIDAERRPSQDPAPAQR